MPGHARFTVEERREHLLELGLRLFAARPYDEISIEEIAHEAGISKGLLYHYFPSKRDFYVACLREVAAELSLITRADPRLSPGERVRASVSAYLGYVQLNLRNCQAFVRGGIGADPEVAAITEGTRRAIWERMLERMGVSSEELLLRVTIRAWVSFVEIAALEWAEAGAPEKGQLIEVIVAALVAVIRTSRRPEATPEDRPRR